MTSALAATRLKRAGRKSAKPSSSVVRVTGGDKVANPDIAAARRVLLMEANGLAALAAGLDAAITKAVDLLFSLGGDRPALTPSGRVIVSGMGKSGHVAHKIAATMASTGTPALFVHPAEASHGDRGMLPRGDVVIRSEERRVGQEYVGTCRSRWSPSPEKTKRKTQHAWHRNMTDNKIKN